MIGPHEGTELAMMLAGEKPLAMFHDSLPDSGDIPEYIIPEKAFAPHVASGTIKRISKDVLNCKNGQTIRYVCFAVRGQEWRAEFLLWLKEENLSARLKHNPSHDEIIGKLLGYTDEDILYFLG